MSDINRKKYSIFFDYLRVFAILGVVAVHCAYNFPLPLFFKEVMYQGSACVQIFFVMSAYLGCAYFYRPGASVFGYYKKRAFRIIPIYYTAILLAMVYIEVFRGGTQPDDWGLGWLRYFLGLNTLLPSNSFGDWNNCFGFWAMGCFLFFYAVMPLIIKCVTGFRSSIVFFVICWGVSFLLPHIENIDLLLIRMGPLFQMQYFALGVVAFYAVREQKQSLAIILMLLIALLPHSLNGNPMVFALLSGVAIMAVKNEDLIISHGSHRVLKFFSKYSFHIYLSSYDGLVGCACGGGQVFRRYRALLLYH